MADRPLRIGNCSGFLGDRLGAMREMLDGGPLDVLTGDYLAELTLLILFRSRAKDPAKGYATTFLRQLEDCLGLALDSGVRIVANAGGLNPQGCAEAVRALAERLGLQPAVAHVEGDDLLPGLDELELHHIDTGDPLAAQALTANAYLGAFGIAEGLRAGADVVVTGRVTDASLVVGPAAWWHDWKRDEYDALAGAVVAGHVLECGAQATGGNYSFMSEVPGMEHIGFPIAEVSADGSCVITKHESHGGLVSVGTITAQLLYEIGAPAYLGPDVTADFSTITLEQVGANRVRVSGTRGLPPPPTTKVCVNTIGGLRNSVTFLLTGLDIDAKADLLQRQLQSTLDLAASYDVRLERTTATDPATNAEAVSRLTFTVKGTDPAVLGRAFSSACVEVALASYPGCTLTAPPGDASPYGVYWPGVVDNDRVHQVVVLADGSRLNIPAAPRTATPPSVDVDIDTLDGGGSPHRRARRVPLGVAFGARSGDKGGDANLGVWARSDAGYRWLRDELTVERIKQLLPECAPLQVQRHLLPNLRAVNFVLRGFLGEGVSSGTRLDPQAKGLGEWLRAREVELPEEVLP
ncbi:MAG: hypothetical protein QOE64_1496 [Frankiales bacterium]|nr:hypothetical protein [Frankiales bacterium]